MLMCRGKISESRDGIKKRFLVAPRVLRAKAFQSQKLESNYWSYWRLPYSPRRIGNRSSILFILNGSA